MPRLKSLQLDYDPTHLGKWMEFFRDHTQLRRLYPPKTYNTPYDASLRDVDLFTADLSNLADAIFGIQVEAQIDSIIAFLDNHSNLNTCSVFEVDFNAEDKYFLCERLGVEWNIEFKSMLA